MMAARLCLADVYLDTFPYNAGSTARDVLDANLPLVTYSGHTFISRMAGSMLHGAGLDELITHSLADYEARVVDLVRQPARLTSLKQQMAHMAPQRQSAPERLVKSLEQQLIQRLQSQA